MGYEFKTRYWTRDDSYNAEDLNRVEANTQFMADYFALAGYRAMLEGVETGRTQEGLPRMDELNRIEGNIHALATVFLEPPGYEQPRVWESPSAFHDYTDANRLERNLLLLYIWTGRTIDAFRYCGTFSCGEGGEIY